MKRVFAIATLLLMLVSYTGFELCIDYCCDSIESIHLGAAHEVCDDDSCHPGANANCCDSDEVVVDQQLLEYTKVTVALPQQVPVPAVQSVSLTTPMLVSQNISFALQEAYAPPLSVLAQTQSVRC